MAQPKIKVSLSVSQRLWTLGAAATVGIVTMIGVGIYEGRQITKALATAETLRQQVEQAVEMRHANVTMVLAAMDTIVDRAEKQVHADRVQIVADSVKILRDGAPTVQSLADALDLSSSVTSFKDDLDILDKAISVDLKALVEQGAPDSEYDKIDNAIDAGGETMATMLADLAQKGGQAVRDRLAEADAASSSAFYIQLVSGLVALVLTLAMQMFHGNSLKRGICAVRVSMLRILDGDITTPVDAINRGDEIGEMARATEMFRKAAEEKRALEHSSDEARRTIESERHEREARQREDEAAIRFAVDALKSGLQKLADGDITARIDTPFREDFDGLRRDFNQSISELQAVVTEIRTNSMSIQSYSKHMLSAAEDLAKRTEQQAASLEQTSAALDQITVRVQSSAERANVAGGMVEGTRQTSERSGKVVSDAMSAMERIEDASREIGNIINVIDEIAFQTNLLALNAGVEAARAGEAGKGFAVVAQEVRELAGRAATAAKDIKTLVHKSSEEVRTGVDLVTATGDVLSHIGEDVVQISDHVLSIAAAAHEQNTGLQEINAAVAQMDQVTQRNAAMVEETNAASVTLAQDADKLIQAISRFKLGERNSSYNPVKAVSEPQRPQPSPARTLVNRVAGAFNRNTATARAEPVRASDNWEEF